MGRTRPILTATHILEKEFHIDTRGYRMTEVDYFLDIVYADYKLYDEKLLKYDAELKDSRAKIMLLEKEVERLQTRLSISKENEENSANSNVDLLKRLSELEKIVYKK